MRPDHPLPPPVVKEPVAGPSEPKKDDKSKKKDKKAEKAAKKNKNKEADKPKEVSLSPPSRARLVKIDPTHWQPKHLREGDLENLPDTSEVKTKPVKAKKTEKPAKKVVKEPSPVQPSETSDTSDEESSSDEDEPGPSLQQSIAPPGVSASAKVTKAQTAADVAYDEAASLAERKANLDLVAKLLGGLPKPLEPVQDAVQKQLDEESSSSENESAGEESVRTGPAGSPRAAGASEPQVAMQSSQPAETALVQDEVMQADGTESSSSEDEEEEDETNLDATRNEDEDALDATAEGKDYAANDAPHSSITAGPRLVEVQMQSLTEMFKPQEAAGELLSPNNVPETCTLTSAISEGFSLGDLLDDFEVEELEEELPAPIIRTCEHQNFQAVQPAWSAPAYAAAPARAPAATGTLFFPFPLEEDEQPGGLLTTMDEQQRERVLERSWTGTSNVRRFKRTQTM